MSHFFPSPHYISSDEGINSYLFELNDPSQTTILISTIAPGAELKMHDVVKQKHTPG